MSETSPCDYRPVGSHGIVLGGDGPDGLPVACSIPEWHPHIAENDGFFLGHIFATELLCKRVTEKALAFALDKHRLGHPGDLPEDIAKEQAKINDNYRWSQEGRAESDHKHGSETFCIMTESNFPERFSGHPLSRFFPELSVQDEDFVTVTWMFLLEEL